MVLSNPNANNLRAIICFQLIIIIVIIINHDSDSNTDYNWCTWNGRQRLGKGTGKSGNRRTCRDHPNYSITKIGQNNEKSSRDVRRLLVTQTPSTM